MQCSLAAALELDTDTLQAELPASESLQMLAGSCLAAQRTPPIPLPSRDLLAGVHPVDKVLLEDADVRQAAELYANDPVSISLATQSAHSALRMVPPCHGAATVQFSEAIQEVPQLKQTHTLRLMVLPAPCHLHERPHMARL